MMFVTFHLSAEHVYTNIFAKTPNIPKKFEGNDLCVLSVSSSPDDSSPHYNKVTSSVLLYDIMERICSLNTKKIQYFHEHYSCFYFLFLKHLLRSEFYALTSVHQLLFIHQRIFIFLSHSLLLDAIFV